MVHDAKAVVEIHYCTGCRWMMRAAWTAQELLSTFEGQLASVALCPSDQGGTFDVFANGSRIFSRRENGGFCELKHLKQLLRDHIVPEKDLGHSDA